MAVLCDMAAIPRVMLSFLEKCSFAPPRVYGGSLQRASSSAGEMSVEGEVENGNCLCLSFPLLKCLINTL